MRYIAASICLLLFAGCMWTEPNRPVTLMESEFFPVKVEVNGVSFDKMSILDIIDMNDWSQVKITPVRKGTEEGEYTHFLITPRAIGKLRPKAE